MPTAAAGTRKARRAPAREPAIPAGPFIAAAEPPEAPASARQPRARETTETRERIAVASFQRVNEVTGSPCKPAVERTEARVGLFPRLSAAPRRAGGATVAEQFPRGTRVDAAIVRSV